MDMHVDMTRGVGGWVEGQCRVASACGATWLVVYAALMRLFVFKVGVVGVGAVPFLLSSVLHLPHNLFQNNFLRYCDKT